MAAAGDDDLADVILVVVIAGLILAIGTVAASSLVGSQQTTDVQTHALLDGTDWTRLGNSVGVEETVYDSRGYAIELTGASDSFFESKQQVTIASDETWSLSVWLSTQDTSTTRTAVSLSGRLVLSHTASGDWSAWYYDEGERNSYYVNASTPSQPGTLSHLIVTRNATALALYRNATRVAVTDITVDNIAPDPDAENWDGRVEELRTFDDEVNGSVRSALYASPIDPQPNTNRTMRAMFDEPYASDQLLLFTAPSLRTSNAQFADGLNGHVMHPADALLGQADYEWRAEGPQIRATDGGELENAPVAYVDYGQKGVLDSFIPQWNTLITFGGLAMVVIVLATIVAYLQVARAAR